jgi:hypothetical protein
VSTAYENPATAEHVTLPCGGAGNFTLFGFVETMCEGESQQILADSDPQFS